MPSSSLLIVVPTLNSHVLLPRLLTSLQQQTWSHWHLLFIDGPSGHEHRQWLQQCCVTEPRCFWIAQDPCQPGIFGAMNQGFAAAADWLLFWGSDDWAASRTVLAEAMAALEAAETSDTQLRNEWPDLLVCSGRYANAAQNSLGRIASFHPPGLLSRAAYRRALLLGSTPPHQATLFGLGARSRQPWCLNAASCRKASPLAVAAPKRWSCISGCAPTGWPTACCTG